MKLILSILLLSVVALADSFAVKPLSEAELNIRQMRSEEEPTYKTKVFEKEKVFYTGLLKLKKNASVAADVSFLKSDDLIPKSVLLSDRIKLAPVKNQGSCGSCVYFATSSTLEDTWLSRMGIALPPTAPQYIMDCGSRNSMCSGSWFEIVAGDLKNKGAVRESDYPYRGVNQSCKGQPEVIARIEDFKIIDNSPKSAMAALKKGHAVATTIGAGGAFMNYSSGIFNGCSSVGTNHEMSIVGADCETSVDAAGNCVFDAQGNLPPGVGYWVVRNSWGTGWGDDGFIKIKMTSKSGALCNNIAEELGILVLGKDPVPPGPGPGPGPGPTPVPPSPINVPWYLWAIIGLLGIGLVLSLVIKRK